MNCTKNTVYDYQPAKSISESMLEVSLLGGGIAVVSVSMGLRWMTKTNYTKAESNQRTQPAYSCKQNTITTTPFSCSITIPSNNIWPAATDKDNFRNAVRVKGNLYWKWGQGNSLRWIISSMQTCTQPWTKRSNHHCWAWVHNNHKSAQVPVPMSHSHIWKRHVITSC